jgi:DNA-binding XRE family transcriptional regulator
MIIGSKIAFYRKKLCITQDALAQKLEVSNQAVSKWESDQCCPDISLLPLLADIFEITIDELFDRKTLPAEVTIDTPWEDDNTLHVAVFHGRKYIGRSDACTDMTFQYEGPALSIDCAVNLHCNAVSGNVTAGGSVECDDVYGSVQAGGSVSCNEVNGSVQAGGNVTCDDVNGNVDAGGNVTCDTVECDAKAGGNITCDEICGTATADGDIYCDEINMESHSDHTHREAGSNNIHIHKTETSDGNTHTITYTISKD